MNAALIAKGPTAAAAIEHLNGSRCTSSRAPAAPERHIRSIDWRRFENRCERPARRIAIRQRVIRILLFGRIERDRLDHQTAFAFQLVGMSGAHDRLELAAVAFAILDRFLGGLDDPFRFAQHRVRVDGPGDGVQHPAIGSAEVSRDIAALFLFADDAEGADALEGGDKMLVEIFANFGIGQSVHTEHFSVVSGVVRFFEVAGDVNDEDEFFVFEGFGRGVFGIFLKATLVP